MYIYANIYVYTYVFIRGCVLRFASSLFVRARAGVGERVFLGGRFYFRMTTAVFVFVCVFVCVCVFSCFSLFSPSLPIRPPAISVSFGMPA